MRKLFQALPWRRAKPGEAFAYEPTADPAFLAQLQEMADAIRMPVEPTADQVREEWHALFTEQTEVLEATVQALTAQTLIVDQARNLMTVLAQRSHGNSPLFLINTQASPGEVDTLRHAIAALQAVLVGSEMPDMVAVDRVTH